ncbi:PREDICTED: tetraspanin-6-like [Eufriesea mexicana]|uniref:tetraspanin-6-like n=1 Tax=Eufriesea mexicana TaxID=516756 RepID=UPI00083BB8C4|nr:PREDICTED: tetraspanin-6-like [Eufriesea mexicana]
MTERLETVVVIACMKTLLMLFNCFFWTFGILILCIGIWVRIQLQHYMDVSDESSWHGLLAFASLGAVLTLTATFACCCITREQPALLYLYGAFLGIMALLEFAIGSSIYIHRSNLNEKFDRDWNKTMAIYGQNQKKTSDIDAIQTTLQCCGNKHYTDWLNTNPPQEIPRSCCKVQDDTCDTNNENDIHTQGCSFFALYLVNKQLIVVAGIVIGVAFLPVIGAFLACCLASNINKVKYEQVA